MKKIVIIAILFLFSCKKEEQKPSISTETKKEIKVKNSVKKYNPNSTDKNIDNDFKESIVLSCGTGCAYSLSSKKIKVNRSKNISIAVDFEVEMFVDEELEDTYNETYIFMYDDSNELIRILRDNENILETFPLGSASREGFENFGKRLLQHINKK